MNVKKAKTTETKKPMGRPRKHATDSIACVVKLPPAVVAWIDQRYATRQEGLETIMQNVIRHGSRGWQHF
jgi:hypothetical protein